MLKLWGVLMKKLTYIICLSLVSFFVFSEDEDGGIEEVIVTAERQASSIQDTALSITAFDENLIEDLNLRNQEDLQNYIPATTIQPYDISIRGFGRMFRALGGDRELVLTLMARILLISVSLQLITDYMM